MYQAKASGRDCFRFFDQGMQAAVDERAALEADLREGLERGELLLHYQLQVNRVSGLWRRCLRVCVPA